MDIATARLEALKITAEHLRPYVGGAGKTAVDVTNFAETLAKWLLTGPEKAETPQSVSEFV